MAEESTDVAVIATRVPVEWKAEIDAKTGGGQLLNMSLYLRMQLHKLKGRPLEQTNKELNAYVKKHPEIL